MNLFGVPIRRGQVIAFAGDFIAVSIALYLGHFLRFEPKGADVSFKGILELTTGASMFFVVTHLGLLYIVGAYEGEDDTPLFAMIPKLWMGSVAAFVVQMAIFYAAPNWQWGRGVTLIGFMSFTILLTGWRSVAHRFISLPGPARRTLILGTGAAAKAVGELISKQPAIAASHRLLGYLGDNEAESAGLPADVVGPPNALTSAFEELGATQVVVAYEGHLDDVVTKGLLDLKAKGASIVDMATFFKEHTGRVPIHHLLDTWMIFAPGFGRTSRAARSVTRVFDIFFTVVLIATTWPLMLAAAIAIKLSSRGPIVYAQERLGLNRRPFMIYKLRTMRTDAEAGTGAVWSKGAEDPRVTAVGRFLRRSRIDELPQLWNVLKGDMALVGPRPERQHFVELLEEEIPYYGLRFAAKPGVTGWAQISYGYGASVEDAATKLEYELYAIQEGNPVLYLLVLVKTVQTVLFKPGS